MAAALAALVSDESRLELLGATGFFFALRTSQCLILRLNREFDTTLRSLFRVARDDASELGERESSWCDFVVLAGTQIAKKGVGKMELRVRGIPSDEVARFRNGGVDGNGQRPLIRPSTGLDPCRHCLDIIAEGDEKLVLGYRPFQELQPYARAALRNRP